MKKWSLYAILLIGLALQIGEAGFSKFDPAALFSNRLNHVKISSPVTCRGLTIIPLSLPEDRTTILSFDEALSRNLIKISEINGGEVNRLAVENFSDYPVFIMSGEILTGCKQDRILQNDLLLSPHSGRIEIPAFCVEPGRWQEKSDKFSSGKSVTPPSLRQVAKETRSQEGVWNSVRTNLKSCSKAAGAGNVDNSGSQSMQRVYENQKVDAAIKSSQAYFADLPDKYPQMNGVVVAVNGRILCADLFCSRKLFCKMWEKLLYSYCLESLKCGDELPPVSKRQVSGFLNQAANAELDALPYPEDGWLFSLEHPRVSGSALLTHSSLVHSALYPKSGNYLESAPQSTPLYRNYR